MLENKKNKSWNAQNTYSECCFSNTKLKIMAVFIAFTYNDSKSRVPSLKFIKHTFKLSILPPSAATPHLYKHGSRSILAEWLPLFNFVKQFVTIITRNIYDSLQKFTFLYKFILITLTTVFWLYFYCFVYVISSVG